MIKADAFGAQEFTGVVTSIAPALGAQRITSRGPRRPNDVEVPGGHGGARWSAATSDGMRVDVFFKSDAAS